MNLFKTISETELPIDSELVAAGDGAFSILIANLDSLISKSSNKPPVRSQAWALTPAPPSIRSDSVISGINSCNALVKADLEKDL